jgi:putative ubiquitin-RnfH superfamily antitoxin RatB of RatAB toxin-antitoxin module
MASDKRLAVTLVYSPVARDVREFTLFLAPGSSVLHALHASQLLELFPLLDSSTLSVGVWGRKAALDQQLQENDRVEIYRPLRVDPKLARRERFARQGARTAGLFSKKRVGAKAGY